MTDGQGQDTASAPPGWYRAADGQVRWWDGSSWLATLPERPPDPALAVLPHLALFVMPVFAALALRLTLGQKDPFIKHHATEALNAQIWFGIIWNAVGLAAFALLVTSGDPDPDPRLFLTVWLSMFGMYIATAVLSVIGAVKAYRRTWWRYPLTPYRFVRGARVERSTT